MRAFCGILNYKQKNADYRLLRRMGMYLGRAHNRALTASLLPCCAMMFCSDARETGEQGFQPAVRESRGHSYMSAVLCDDTLDGKMFFDRADSVYLAESVTEGYISEGISFLERLCAGVSLCIFNGAYGEAVLLSDKMCERAIYYTLQGDALYFSSELGAVLCVIEDYRGKVMVNAEALSRHLFSPNDSAGESLFENVGSLRSGEGIIFSNFGLSRFSSEGAVDFCPRKSWKKLERFPMRGNVGDVGRENIFAAANKALHIFGYPQFDMYMPAAFSVLEDNCKLGEMARRNIFFGIENRAGLGSKYIRERARIIGGEYGVKISSEICEREGVGERIYSAFEERRMLKMLCEGLESMLRDKSCPLYELFDAQKLKKLKILKNKKSIPERIRLAGMLYQSVKWLNDSNIKLS